MTPSDPPTPAVAVVPVTSAWWSKIQWTQVVGAIGTLVASNALGLDPATQVKVVAGWSLAQNLLTMVFRGFFNGSVNPSSLPPTGGSA